MTSCKQCGNELPMNAKYCPICGAPVEVGQGSSAPNQDARLPESGMKMALWSERFVAWLIDIVILDFVLVVLGAIFYPGAPLELIRSEGWWALFFNFTRSGLVFFLYWMFMDSVYGRSVGKMIMKLRVARVDGKRVNFGLAALESVGKAFILPLDFLLGYFLYPGQKQRVFNRLSDTVVIHED